jgi:hypothetical protein
MPVYLRFRGEGHEVTKLFPLDPGLYVFHLAHNGERNFAVWLFSESGSRIALLANEIGAFDGSKAVHVERRGNYLLDINADGGWAVTVETPH